MKKNHLAIGATVLAVLLVAAWALGFLGGTDPAVASAIQLSEQAFNSNASEAERDQSRAQLRTIVEGFTPQQRDAFFSANRGQFEQRAEQRMKEFFAMSKADQQKRLDEMINRMMQPGDRGAGGPPGRGRGGDRGGRGNLTEAQRDERSKRRLDRSSPQMRAQFAEFRKKLDARAKERGISQLPGWGGPPRPRG